FLQLFVGAGLLVGLFGFTRPATAQTNQNIVSSIAWSPDGTRLAVSYQFGPLEILDVQTGEVVFTDSTLRVVNSLDWSRLNPNQLAIGGDVGNLQGRVIILDTASGATVHSW